jgi:hypothetical protein
MQGFAPIFRIEELSKSFVAPRNYEESEQDIDSKKIVTLRFEFNFVKNVKTRQTQNECIFYQEV